MNKILDLCTGMGLLGLAFADRGFNVIPGCEINPEMRDLHAQLHPKTSHLEYDIKDLSVMQGVYAGIIGGPPCQALSKTRSMHPPKFPDLTDQVQRILDEALPYWWIFENVAPLNLRNSIHTPINAMHYYQPHQSRARWFTHSANITPPTPVYSGNVDDLRAYSVVAGKIYGPKRGAWLQGYEAAADLKAPKCCALQMGLANAVPYPVGCAWAQQARIANR